MTTHVHGSLTTSRIIDAIEGGDCVGFCIGCGYEEAGIESDAYGYECDNCGCPLLYGAEEILTQFNLWKEGDKEGDNA